MQDISKPGYYILLFSLHGLIRHRDVELGHDADTGGQVKYVLEMMEHLSRRPEVARVDLFTRQIKDKRYSPDYSNPVEPINDHSRIVRLPCGGGRYIRKEKLWPYLDEYIDQVLRFLKHEPYTPDWVHGHYADGGYVAMRLAEYLGSPLAYTAHSLGRPKFQKLSQEGLSDEEIEKSFGMARRIEIEESVLGVADHIFTSTQQEAEEQYGLYENHGNADYTVNPPGLDLELFYPYDDEDNVDILGEEVRDAFLQELNQYFFKPEKPLVLALCRPDKRKNISALIHSFGQSAELQSKANLAVFMGISRNMADMEERERAVLADALMLMDQYGLYGKMALPKKPGFRFEVPEFYRIAARLKGVFVNPALTEPFGITLLESAACGLPIVATNHGGPVDIVQNCTNGLLVDVSHVEEISQAILKILNDPDLWNRFSKSGIENVRKVYSWGSSIQRYLDRVTLKALSGSKSFSISKRKNPVAQKLMQVERMVVCDIDNTLTGNPESTARLIDLLSQNRNRIAFGIATGRTIDSALKHLEKSDVPVPDFLITSVGSEIYYGSTAFKDNGWTTHINYKWDRERVRELMSGVSFLEPQEVETEREYKISYFMEPDPLHVQTVRDLLSSERVRHNLIYSHQRYLDILPQRASKGKALRYLSFKWGLPLNRFLVAGDSGNDEEMLRGEPYGIVVGNYSKEMEILRGKWRIYFANKTHAAGVLEGIQHYRFLEMKND
ncbi:MAG: HAD-IIB family hydrolase [Candidatus Nitronauta litoralis]|uniref:sucrose-phosphate synthase n=1 Tax=Candidatus Nitronauta litoralis TaxID=2705533 RepID=A0A7T0BXF5_9BACT|nr:MAG: HAD-IIB family hydrolase [Candidatus Nitronauta litoralis]